MKKRILSVIIAAITALSLTACAKTTTGDNPATTNPDGTGSSAVTDVTNAGGDESQNTEEKIVPKFVYSTLADDEKEIYDKILKGIENFEDEVDLGAEYPTDKVLTVYKHVFFQEPEIFWFYATNEQFKTAGDTMSKVALQYRYQKDESAAMKEKIDATLDKIEATFPENANDVDKVIAIHDYIIEHTAFSKDDVYAKNAYGALVGGYSQCEGYAKALALACNHFGIENVRITGDKWDGNSHAWSKVKIDGKWYNVDVTWDDPESSNGEQLLRHNYLFVPDEAINGKTHIVICDFEPPVADSTDIDYFKYKNLYATTADEAVSLLHDLVVNQAKYGETVCQVKCSSKDVYDAALKQLIDNGGHQKIANDAKEENEDFSSFGLMNDGELYIIHFNIKYK